jgi:NAD(P)H dehydrogenase (quinone)
MLKGLVVYDSKTGNTEKMAIAIGRGMEKAGLDVKVKKVEDADMDDLVNADAIAFGSPTYFANMTSNMKEFIDKSVEIYPNQLRNKVGAAFTSWAGIGAETTLLSLIMAMFLHRMVIVGHQTGDFGAISFGAPDDKHTAQCEACGERIADITKAIAKK